MISLNGVIQKIHENCNIIFTSINVDFLKEIPKRGNLKHFDLLFSKECKNEKSCKYIFEQLDSSLISALLTTNYGKSGGAGYRKDLAQKISKNYDLLKENHNNFRRYFNNNTINENLSSNTLIDIFLPKTMKNEGIYIIRALQRLSHQKHYADFFWWTMMYALFQEDIALFYNELPIKQYINILKHLENKNIDVDRLYNSQMIEIPEACFWDLRREIILNAQGHLIIAGQSLMDAFNNQDSHSIVSSLKKALNNNQISKVSILLTDPSIFDGKLRCSDPINDIDFTITSIEEHFYKIFEKNQIQLHIYFLPMFHIDHSVITDDFMVFRSTKLWTHDRHYKGCFSLYQSSYYINEYSEYKAHKDYLLTIMNCCTDIYPKQDIDDETDDKSARGKHMKWRKHIKNSNYRTIFMHKMYNSQLLDFVFESWNDDPFELFTKSENILNYNDLFNPENLINDDAQKVLLPYLQVTNNLFTKAIKKHDSSENSYSIIFPSLDLGFPNNVQRLAGGFATGMLITWKCGTDIVPIDATVNVCSSSVFRLNNFDPTILETNFKKYLNESIFLEASNNKGYSFSFSSGNHFFMIAKDKGDNYYLVLHSSANELKNSFMGLYPVEKNWYSSKIKHLTDKNNRYIRYLKDDDARNFITMAHNFESYNEQIHRWLSKKINNDKECEWEIIKHHYYMPTDSSIAIGTFAEKPGTVVPIFSMPGKPIYLFRIGDNNWTIDLGAQKGRVCLVPHGWGQNIKNVKSIKISNDYKRLILQLDKDYEFEINSKSHINCEGKHIRTFKNGQEFLKIGTNMIQGEIVDTLYPVFLLCQGDSDVKL